MCGFPRRADGGAAKRRGGVRLGIVKFRLCSDMWRASGNNGLDCRGTLGHSHCRSRAGSEPSKRKFKRSSGRLSLYLKESARSARLSLCSAPLAFDGPAFINDARGRDLIHMADSAELICKFGSYSSIYDAIRFHTAAVIVRLESVCDRPPVRQTKKTLYARQSG